MKPTLRHKVAKCVVVLAGIALSASSAWAGVTIIASPGPFPNIEQAAKGEEKVDWWDGNLADDRACTECFAAMELVQIGRAHV